jgi:predicted AlkP superfamily pyrophosphatase or phosphodiesterase
VGESSNGSFIDMYIYHITDTKAGHSEMLTGYPPMITGVYNNRIFKPIPEGYSVFERLEGYFRNNNINTVMLTGKAGHIGSRGPQIKERIKRTNIKEDITRGEKLVIPNLYGEPFYRTKNSIDIWDGDQQRDADVVGEKALKYIENYGNKLFFMFFHFSDPDHNGHKYGENSNEYNDAIIKGDYWLGKIVDKLKEMEKKLLLRDKDAYKKR